MARKLPCQQCGGVMKRKARMDGGIARGMLSFSLVLIGLGLYLTIVGAIPGVIIIALGALVARKRQKVWQCAACRAYIPRG